MTFPVKFEDAASSDNFPIDMRVSTDLMNKGGKKNDVKNVDYTNYEEDIYVGYRYFDTLASRFPIPRLRSFLYHFCLRQGCLSRQTTVSIPYL